jgi:hypothetical protein
MAECNILLPFVHVNTDFVYNIFLSLEVGIYNLQTS